MSEEEELKYSMETFQLTCESTEYDDSWTLDDESTINDLFLDFEVE